MVLTKSQMLALGTRIPNFDLEDVVSNKNFSRDDLDEDKPTLIMFICNHCPFVKHIEKQIAEFGKDYKDKINIVAISSNDVDTHPDDSPNFLKDQAERFGFTFFYLYDENQEVAKAFTAACTPDFFLFGKDKKLVYRGQFDDSRPGGAGGSPTGSDLRAAVDALLEEGEVPTDQKPSVGCNIKWKYGNEPEYFK